MEDNF